MLSKTPSSMSMFVLMLLLFPLGTQSSEQPSGMILGGSTDAPIRIEVFSDFQCPACRLFYRELVLPTLQDYARKDKVCVVYHEFPLSIHKFAYKAARYCEAAYIMGRDKALQIIDTLFSNQSQWDQDGNVEAILAKSLSKQDFSKLKSNLQDPSINRSIAEGIRLGAEMDVHGTPTMFVYYLGRKQKVENPQQMSFLVLKGFFDQIVK